MLPYFSFLGPNLEKSLLQHFNWTCELHNEQTKPVASVSIRYQLLQQYSDTVAIMMKWMKRSEIFSQWDGKSPNTVWLLYNLINSASNSWPEALITDLNGVRIFQGCLGSREDKQYIGSYLKCMACLLKMKPPLGFSLKMPSVLERQIVFLLADRSSREGRHAAWPWRRRCACWKGAFQLHNGTAEEEEEGRGGETERGRWETRITRLEWGFLKRN